MSIVVRLIKDGSNFPLFSVWVESPVKVAFINHLVLIKNEQVRSEIVEIIVKDVKKISKIDQI